VTASECHNKLVRLAEGLHNHASQQGGNEWDTARRLRVLETARRWKDRADQQEGEQPQFDFLRTYNQILRDAGSINTPQVPPPAPPVSAVYLPQPVNWDELRADDYDDEPFLLEPVLVEGRAHSLYAPAKTGKSLFILEAVVALATGSPFLARPASEPVDVLYLDYEMTKADLRHRLEAMGKLDADLGRLHYFLIPALDPLDTAAGGAQLETLAARYNARMIVIDTTARAIEGAENEADTIRALYRHTGARLKAAGITTLRVDHAGKDVEKGQRGTSAKNDDVDVVWQLTGADDRLTLKCTHQRVGFLPPQIALRRGTDPLEHTIIEDAWPAGTADLAERLDRLELTVNTGRPAVRQAIAEWNDANPHDRISATARLLEAAIRYRRSSAQIRGVEDIIGRYDTPEAA
jgi:hypothetical protein